MDIIVGPELAAAATASPFACVPELLIGTGTLYLREPGTELDVDCGNFSIVSLSPEGEVFTFFSPACSDRPSAGGVTSAYRLELTGDSFSLVQLARILNEPIVSTADGDVLNLETVRDLTMRRATFRKDLDFGNCDTLACNQLELILWHCYFDLPNTYTLSQDEIAVHVFNLVAMPDAENHPANPFGYLQRVCPVTDLS